MKRVTRRAGALLLATAMLAGGVNVAVAAEPEPSALSDICRTDWRGNIDDRYQCGVELDDNVMVKEGNRFYGEAYGKPYATVSVVLHEREGGKQLAGSETRITFNSWGYTSFSTYVPKLPSGFNGGYFGVSLKSGSTLLDDWQRSGTMEVLSERIGYAPTEGFGSGTADDPWSFSLSGGYPGHTFKMQLQHKGSWVNTRTLETEPADQNGGTYLVAVAPDSVPVGEYSLRLVNARTGAVGASLRWWRGGPPTLTAATAGVKRTGERTNVWGTALGVPSMAPVVTQVRIGNRWSTSQRGEVPYESNNYALPLTYGASTPGTYTYRVGVKTEIRWVWSKPVTITRVGLTASTAGKKRVRQATNVWGTVRTVPAGSRVVVQARVGSKWSTSRSGTVNSKGQYALPLTYGANRPGTYTYRVGVKHPKGWVWSQSVKLVRTR